MARTLPIPTEQPLDAARKAAGHVATLAGARRWPCRRQPPSRWPHCCGRRSPQPTQSREWPARWASSCRYARSRSSRWSWKCPDRAVQDGARRRPVAVGGSARGQCDHAGGGGGIRAPGPVHRRHGARRPRSGADARRGAGRAARADAVPGGDRNRGVHRPGRPRPRPVRLRRLAAVAAAHLGCRLVASGVAPCRTPGLAALTCQPRYQELARRYGPVVTEAGICACHVHVGVPSRDLGVQVLARLRPWLAPLLAVTANSPIADGHDTGWASWRYTIQTRWPTAVPPEVWPDAAAYDTAVRRLIGSRAALDEQSVYFLARLSPRYPTVEVRVADVCLDADTAVLAAGLTRALVATALPRPAAGRRWQRRRRAGRRGPGRCGTSGARRGRSRPVHRAGRRCADTPRPPLDHVHPALSDHGDTDTVTRLLHRLDQRGTGADRQRALFTSAASTRRSSRRSPARRCPATRSG